MAVPGFEYSIAKGWVAASRGSVSEAIAETLSAAETARANGQFAAEVICLQTAAQFGERSRSPFDWENWRASSKDRVHLWRPGSRPRWKPNDAAELAAVSIDFEQMGDTVAALDAAAHAAMAFRPQGSDESSAECARHAKALGDDGGAVAPHIQCGAEPLIARVSSVVRRSPPSRARCSRG